MTANDKLWFGPFNGNVWQGKDITADVSPVLYRGTELDAQGKIAYQNAGHLGALDAIDGAAVFKGGVMMKPALKGIRVE